jgi:hypothetical protein
LSPRISTTTIRMSLLMTMLSFFFRDSTNMIHSFATAGVSSAAVM